MKHLQTIKLITAFFPALASYDIVVSNDSVKKTISPNLAVDQFFSQKQNLFEGEIDTSPTATASPAAAAHCSPVQAERPWPSDTPADVIAGSTVSKHCQSLADIQKLSGIKPKEADFLDVIKDDTSAVGVGTSTD